MDTVDKRAERRSETALREAVEHAEVLLHYASGRGISLAPEIVKALVGSKVLLAANVNDPATFDQQAEFWDAREKLATAIHPVTITSLNATTQTINRSGLLVDWLERWFGPAQFTPADQAVHQFRRWAFWALFALLTIQVYWVVGTHLTQEIGPLLEQVQANAKQQESLRVAGKRADSPELQDLEADALLLEKEMAFRHEILHQWNAVWRRPFTALGLVESNHPAEVGPGAAYAALKKGTLTAGFTVRGLERYVLPLLYGFLGACLYVLRTLANDIKTLAYSPEQNTLYRLRVYMGSLAGLIIIWFLPVAQAEAGLQSLTPFALAFLSGYSVDLLFALMDKLISTFSSASK